VTLTVAVTWVLAHEGHAPLPSKGARVDVAKGQLTLSSAARAALDVTTAEVVARPIIQGFLAYATVVSPWQKHALATSPLPGRIAGLIARPGQEVKAGEVLAEVDSAELEALRQGVLTARSNLRLAEQATRDQEVAARGGAATEQGLLDARTKLRQEENALAVARAKWAGLGLSVDQLERPAHHQQQAAQTLPVHSPITGTVIHADLAVGKVIEPLEHLFEVVNLSTVWVQIGVLEKDLHRVSVGQPVELRLTAYPGEVFRGAVQVVGSSLDARTHLNTVWAELPNPSGSEPRLLPGMSGEARLLTTASAARAVPTEAVQGDAAGQFVLVEESSTAKASEYHRKAVAAGRRADDWVEIIAGGVVPGDRVVTRGAHELGGFFAPGVLRPGPEAARALELRVEPATAQVVEEVIAIDGTVDLPPDHRASASSPFAGALLKVQVDRGQAVRSGDLLAEVFSLEFQTLQSDLLRAHLEGEFLGETSRRLKSVQAIVPRQRMLELEGQVYANRQQREALRRQLRVAGLTKDELDALLDRKQLIHALPIRSPITGVVAAFDRVLGQAIKAQEPLFTIHDLSRPVVQGYLSERDIGRTHLGQPSRVRLTADPEFLADGRVVRSGRVFGSDSRTLSVWVELAAPPARPLRTNQLVRLTLTTGRPEATLAVPRQAVIADGSKSYVFVRREDGAFERRAVDLGRSDDRFVEVTRGLGAGEPVAVAGAAELQTAYAGLR
jgi:cobalt-zinc-cadmium efflux system membrane fusion protein